MEEKKLAFIGFGNVARALAALLESKQEIFKGKFGFSTRIVAIATGHHGMALDLAGLDIERVTRLTAAGGSLNDLNTASVYNSIPELIRNCGADILFENSPVNHQTGQPAIEHLRTGLECGMHVITANKGPVAYAYRELTELAAQKGRKFYFESSVMDGAPIFSLFRESLPVVEVIGFNGILNSTTNMILGLMENGKTFDQAVRCTQEAGLAETDPDADIDGWDAAIKVSALSGVILGFPILPDQVDRTGIRGISLKMVREAAEGGQRWKLVCRARRTENRLMARVAPELVTPNSPLYSINGSSSFVQFETDILPGLGIIENTPNPVTTAYGLMADMINAVKND